MPTRRRGAIVLGALTVVICRCYRSSTERRDLSSFVFVKSRAVEADAQLNRTTSGFAEDDAVLSNNNVIRVVDSNGSSAGGEDLSMGYNQEPYSQRWQRRFASSRSRNKKGGYLFFRHTRKAGGTSLRVYFKEVLAFHNVSRTSKDFRAAKRYRQSNQYQIYYVESEFQPIDWQCPIVDPRWRESLRIIVLRHPIERHMSEFFFSGPKRGPHKIFHTIDAQQLFANQTYTDELASFLNESVPIWMKGGTEIIGTKMEAEGTSFDIFGRHYTDNFQLRSLAGCTSGECLEERRVTQAQRGKVRELHPSSYSYSNPIPRCTNFFRNEDDPSVLLEFCAKRYKIKDECSVLGCDGPCFYPSAAWGPLGSGDITRAEHILKGFDAVLLMEKLDDVDQSDFLSDVLGVPRDAEFALAKRGSARNSRVEKTRKREKSSYYRRLLSKLGLDHILQMLREENKLEMEFFQRAKRLNEIMIEQWKRESTNT